MATVQTCQVQEPLMHRQSWKWHRSALRNHEAVNLKTWNLWGTCALPGSIGRAQRRCRSTMLRPWGRICQGAEGSCEAQYPKLRKQPGACSPKGLKLYRPKAKANTQTRLQHQLQFWLQLRPPKGACGPWRVLSKGSIYQCEERRTGIFLGCSLPEAGVLLCYVYK